MALSRSSIGELENTPTRMAGQAKFIAIYNAPFWRAAGLSGDAISHKGPLVEIHDASPADGREGALFGFIGLSGRERAALGQELAERALDQLAVLFGQEARAPLRFALQDWAQEPMTATTLDFTASPGHPYWAGANAIVSTQGSELILASSETALEFSGLLEGALEAAQRAYDRLGHDPIK